jgi:hypothetical protein
MPESSFDHPTRFRLGLVLWVWALKFNLQAELNFDPYWFNTIPMLQKAEFYTLKAS